MSAIEVPEGLEVEFLTVRMSAEVDQIATALVAAQATFETYKPDSTAQIKGDKGSYSYNYAKLPDVIAATRPSLNANGIALLQPAMTDGPRVTVETILLHKSGQRISNRLTMKGQSDVAQTVGGTLTYCRRYGLQALLAVAPDMDDDGAAASRVDEQARQRERLAQQEADAEGYIGARIAKHAIPPDTVADLVLEITEGVAADWRGLTLDNKRRLFAALARFAKPATTEAQPAADRASTATASAAAAAPHVNGTTHANGKATTKSAEEIPPAGASTPNLRAWLGKRLGIRAGSWNQDHMAKACAEVATTLGLPAGTITAKNLGDHLPMYRDAIASAAEIASAAVAGAVAAAEDTVESDGSAEDALTAEQLQAAEEMSAGLAAIAGIALRKGLDDAESLDTRIRALLGDPNASFSNLRLDEIPKVRAMLESLADKVPT